MLRGLLLTGGAPLYLRAELGSAGERARSALGTPLAAEISARALWWPPGKVAGRYLAPYLATARPARSLRAAGDRTAAARPAGPRARDDARELALLMADEEAREGDYARRSTRSTRRSPWAAGRCPAPTPCAERNGVAS